MDIALEKFMFQIFAKIRFNAFAIKAIVTSEALPAQEKLLV
jgi:hypothetical protein